MRWFDKLFPIFFLGFGVLIIAGIVGAVLNYRDYMAECKADGRKGYECQMMWQQSQPTVVYVR
jgi:hypothetical protein